MLRQYPLPLPHAEAMQADDYVVTASNAEAAAWINAWPAWPAPCLVLSGPGGSGKTHLLHLWLQKTGGGPVTVNDIKNNDPATIIGRTKYIAIDDAAAIAGDSVAEENLFHIYNRLRENGGGLLLTSILPVALWNIALADLRSRLMAAPAAALGAPDDELLRMLLIKQFHDRQIEIGAGLIDYLLPRIERSAASLRALVAKLDRAALAEGRAVTTALARRILENDATV